MSQAEHVIQGYASTSLSLKAHPVSFARQKLTLLGILSTEQVMQSKAGTRVMVSGIVLSRQRPGTAGGVCFMTIEDEHGTVNLVVFEKLFETYRKEILGAKLLMVQGWVQREGQVLHVIVRSCHDLTAILSDTISSNGEDNSAMSFKTDNKRTQVRENVAGEVIPKARNFR